MYVLRKSFGAYSAGTPVDREVHTGKCYIFNKRVQDSVIGLEVPSDLVIKRRTRTTYRPNHDSSRERRKTKRLARAGM